MLYHATKRENVETIQRSGLTAAYGSDDWIQRREQHQSDLDEMGRRFHSSWVDRQGAIYFWTNLEDARAYAQRYDCNVIVEVNASSLDCWHVDNEIVENLFHEYMDGNDGTERYERLVNRLLNVAKPWCGTREFDHEVWVQPPVSPSEINQILDIAGEPLNQ